MLKPAFYLPSKTSVKRNVAVAGDYKFYVFRQAARESIWIKGITLDEGVYGEAPENPVAVFGDDV